MNERGRREELVSAPLAIDREESGSEAPDGSRKVSQGRKKKRRKAKKNVVESIDERPDLRDFIERVVGTLASMSFLFYCCCLGFVPRRSLFLFIPLGVAFYAGLIIVGRKVHAQSEKRRRKGKRYKFFDVQNESEWIFWLTKLGMVGAMFLLGWLWVSNNLKHDWYLTALVPVLVFICLIFTPASSDPGDGGIDF